MSTQFKLVIKNVKSEDEGFYNCTIGNELGNAFFLFEVKQKSIFLAKFYFYSFFKIIFLAI